MPTVAGTQTGLVGSFGASPRTVTITAPSSGNSIGVTLIDSNGRTITGVTCGNGTSTFLYEDPDGYEFWIVSGITDSPTSISVSFTGGDSEVYVDKVEFVGGIQQHNAQEGSEGGFGSTEFGPSLTSTASGVGGFGLITTIGSVTVTPSSGVSVAPTGAGTRFLTYSASLGAAGSYTFGGALDSAVPRRASAVLIESTGGGGGISLAWIRA